MKKDRLRGVITVLPNALFLNEALGGFADVTGRYVGRGRLVAATSGQVACVVYGGLGKQHSGV